MIRAFWEGFKILFDIIGGFLWNFYDRGWRDFGWFLGFMTCFFGLFAFTIYVLIYIFSLFLGG